MRPILLAVLLAVLSQSVLAFYAPGEGRWLSRDPIGEEGGKNLYGFVGNDGVGGVDAVGLRVRIFELGPKPSMKAQLDPYLSALSAAWTAVDAMSDGSFAAMDVKWNDIAFQGTRQQFLDLIKFELGSKYTHTMITDHIQAGALKQLGRALDGFFTATGNQGTFGNITSKTTNLIIGHGDPDAQATIVGHYVVMVGRPYLEHEEWVNVLVPFAEMRRQQEMVTRRTGSPTVLVSCHSNTRGLMEKFQWNGYSGTTFAHPLHIWVEPLGGGQTQAGWSETWEVSVWRCKGDPLAEAESTGVEARGAVEVGDVTDEKTLKPEELVP